MSRLDDIAARLAAATPGPWAAHDYGLPGQDEPSSIVIHRPPFIWEAVRYGETDDNGGGQVIAFLEWDYQESRDADLIANAPTDLAALLEFARAVAALRSRIAEAQSLRVALPQEGIARDLDHALTTLESSTIEGGPVGEVRALRPAERCNERHDGPFIATSRVSGSSQVYYCTKDERHDGDHYDSVSKKGWRK